MVTLPRRQRERIGSVFQEEDHYEQQNHTRTYVHKVVN
jgi:hypothetical protein